MSSKGLHIISMAVENIMKITSAFIVPTDSTILVQGNNANGKSSVLDAITMAFCKKDAKSFPKEPIKKGSKKGSIVIKVDGSDSIPAFTITRSITEKGESLKIEPEKVLAGETPRSFLDKLIGSISFDPLDFINKDPKCQRSALMELIGLDVEEWERKEKEAFDRRTEIGRDLKVAEAKIKDAVIYEDVSTEEIKVSDLAIKLQKAIASNQEIANRLKANGNLKQSAISNKEKVESIKIQIVDLEKEIDRLERVIADQRTKYKSEKDDLDLTFPIDTNEINSEIQSVESTNSKIRHNIQVNHDTMLKDRVQALYDAAESTLEAIRADKLKAIQEANIPVPGLLFDDDGLVYNSIPLSQCSDGEKLMIGMGISMALNPTMRVLRIKDGSLLDPNNLKIIQDMVRENGFQLWVEKVNDVAGYESSGKVGLYIQEGEVIMMDGKPVEKKSVPAEKKSTKKSDAPITEPKQDTEDW